jgi:hypothetical protein
MAIDHQRYPIGPTRLGPAAPGEPKSTIPTLLGMQYRDVEYTVVQGIERGVLEIRFDPLSGSNLILVVRDRTDKPAGCP